MKTVLMISPFATPNIGGVESHLDKLIAHLSRNGFRAILVTYQPLTTKAKGEGYEKKGNVEIYRVPWFGRGWFPRLEPYFPLVFIYLFPGLFMKSLTLYLRRHNEVDTVHAHGFIAAAVSKALTAIIKKRSVMSTHAIYKLKGRRTLSALIRWLLKDFDAVLAVGEPSRQELMEAGLDGEKIKVHPNWIDTDLFRPMDRKECRRALGLGPDDFTVLFLGRLMEKKGVSLLLAASGKTGKEISFVFAGDGPMAGLIRSEAMKNRKVKYLGRLDPENIPKAYNAADLFVSPVLYDEGFGAAYLEALSCGTPVVTAKRGCLPYFLSDTVSDLLTEVTAESVLKVLEFYFDNRDLLEKKRPLCRLYAEKNFSEENAEVIRGSY